MTTTDVARRCFRLSNASDFAGIAQLFGETTTYRSGNGDFFLGGQDILAMQRAYHGTLNQLAWTVTEVEEIRPGIVRDGIIVHIDVVRKGGGQRG